MSSYAASFKGRFGSTAANTAVSSSAAAAAAAAGKNRPDAIAEATIVPRFLKTSADNKVNAVPCVFAFAAAWPIVNEQGETVVEWNFLCACGIPIEPKEYNINGQKGVSRKCSQGLCSIAIPERAYENLIPYLSKYDAEVQANGSIMIGMKLLICNDSKMPRLAMRPKTGTFGYNNNTCCGPNCELCGRKVPITLEHMLVPVRSGDEYVVLNESPEFMMHLMNVGFMPKILAAGASDSFTSWEEFKSSF